MEKIGGVEVSQVKDDTPVRLFDDPNGREIYAESSHGIFSASGNVTIALYSPRANGASEVYRTIVARITMPASGAHALAVSLFDFLNKTGQNPDSQSNLQ